MKKTFAIILLGLSLTMVFDSCKAKKRYRYNGPSKGCNCPNG
ncbi:hypothetical protein N9I68_01620 [Bacteroidia bacterium]|nr:hypothetical protein [Bacteroidia bacterium]